MASDFHTHFPRNGINALVSAKTLQSGNYTSFEFHPWFLPDEFSVSRLPAPDTLAPFDAIGEIGLDKLRGPELQVQEKYLYALLDISVQTGKPVVLHAVRSFPETLAVLKNFPLKVMVHGFRSSPEMLDELWKKGITVSFHLKAVGNPLLMNKLHHAKGPFGFESDDRQDIDIREIISGAKKTSGMKNLERLTDQFFADFLEI